jgi:hypothetical protein
MSLGAMVTPREMVAKFFTEFASDEVLLNVFSYLDEQSLGRCARVCKRSAPIALSLLPHSVSDVDATVTTWNVGGKR